MLGLSRVSWWPLRNVLAVISRVLGFAFGGNGFCPLGVGVVANLPEGSGNALVEIDSDNSLPLFGCHAGGGAFE